MIAGGGTGGHTSPGLAVAALLRERSVPCAWIGSRDGLEARQAPAAGIPYHVIPTGKLRRYWAWANVTDVLVRVPAGTGRALALLTRLKPRVVFATGGFVALPVVAAAALARIPVVIHEQTSVPGLANRIAARLARRIAVTFPDVRGDFPPAKVVVTGNPLRPELRLGSRADAVARFALDPALPLVYVTGGALGASAINRAIGEILPALLEGAQVVHQCGDNRATGDRAWLEARRRALPEALARHYTVTPWVGAELAGIYAAAALVVGRAGAGTVNECCQLGVPALYIPLPGTRGDEQTATARLVGRAHGCSILPQRGLTQEL
ncbi:MAG: UDP-N-acetylglucosamine--N-acetylmuramyl-(pentapeptide) pyrophosphoryl-undecaprenol N-acetylglucosamine transferase, partial [Candidatus Rokuibacteriota bacterium]